MKSASPAGAWREMGTSVDFALTGEQEMVRSLVERFVSDRYATTDRALHRAPACGYSVENWALLAEMGLLGLNFAELYGGMGSGEVEMATTMEALGRGLVAEPYLNEIVLAGRTLEIAGTETQRQAWIPRILSGETHLALAYAEHTARYDLRSCQTVLETGRVTGNKTLVCAGADALIVTAADTNGIHLCLVDSRARGLVCRDYRLVDGSVASEITLDRVDCDILPADPCALQKGAQSARIAACAEMIGVMTFLFDTTLDYVKQRRQFGAAIGSFQAIQHRLADVYASLELARAHLYRSMLTPPPARNAAIAAGKSFISSVAIKLGEECIQLHGGMGVSDEVSIGHAHKRILVLASFLGDADYELMRYNRALDEPVPF